MAGLTLEAARLRTRARQLADKTQALGTTVATNYAATRASRTRAAEVVQRAIVLRGREVLKAVRARAAEGRVLDLIDVIRRQQRSCVACDLALTDSRGVLFHDGRLVHASCWPRRPLPDHGDS